MSDDALSELIFESQATMRRADTSTHAVLKRVRHFNQLYEALPQKPEGPALLYEEPGSDSVGYHLLGDRLVVGRLPKNERNPTGCDLAFKDDQMSRTHFEISFTDGFYVLRDLQSRNGTFVNNDPQGMREQTLKAGDVILAGSVVFVFTGD